MFYDERIHAGRGKAFRNTLILAVCLFAFCGLTHAIFCKSVIDRPILFTCLIEIVCTAVGLGMILYGEFNFGGRHPDERQTALKYIYYTKAFFVLLYTFAAVYCIFGPLQAAHRDNSYSIYGKLEFMPRDFFPAVIVPCWLYLLMQFKRNELPLNASVLTESGSDYWRRIRKNILHFGWIVLLFTVIGFAAVGVVLNTVPNFLPPYQPKSSLLLAVLLGGVLIWVSYSFYYFVFSASERVSDRAKSEGRLSGMTTAFCWMWIGCTVFLLMLQVFLTVYDAMSIKDGLYQFVEQYLNQLYSRQYLTATAVILPALFVFSLMSELRTLRDNKLHILLTCTSVTLLFTYGEYVVFSNQLLSLRISQQVVAEKIGISDIVGVSHYYTMVCDLILYAALCVLSILIMRRLSTHGYGTRRLFAIIPIGIAILEFQHSCCYIHQKWLEVAVMVLLIGFYITAGITYMRVHRQIREKPVSIDDADFE